MQDKHAVWGDLKKQAVQLAETEPLLSSYYHACVIEHDTFESALSHNMAFRLSSEAVSVLMLDDVFGQCLAANPVVAERAMADIVACYERDPACDSYCRPFLYFKGYLAIQAYRFAHELWSSNRKSLARYIQHQSSITFDVDIHPAARVGSGIMLDHATGIVIGETAIVGDDVSILHGVTLGGTGNATGKRHPTIGGGVMISCGAKILGNITVGTGVKVGGGSLVLESVPDHVTVVGVPAKIVGQPDEKRPALSMNQDITD